MEFMSLVLLFFYDIGDVADDDHALILSIFIFICWESEIMFLICDLFLYFVCLKLWEMVWIIVVILMCYWKTVDAFEGKCDYLIFYFTCFA